MEAKVGGWGGRLSADLSIVHVGLQVMRKLVLLDTRDMIGWLLLLLRRRRSDLIGYRRVLRYCLLRLRR